MNWVLGIGLILVFVFAHETGHFVVGRAVGVQFDEFSIGMGPRLLGWKRNGVDFKLCLLPIGGYVRQAAVDGKPSFKSLAKWRAQLFIWAGVTANFLLAIVGIFLLYWLYVGSGLWQAIGQTLSDFWSLALAVPSVMLDLIIHPIDNAGVTQPAETVTMASHAVSGFHWERIVYFSALINVGIGIVNSLPIMPFDGGQSVNILLHSKRGWSERIQLAFTVVGIAWFMVFIASNILWPLYRQLQSWLMANGYWSWSLPALVIALVIVGTLAYLLNRQANRQPEVDNLHPVSVRLFRR